MFVKNKQNSSVNFLVRAEFFPASPPTHPLPDRPPDPLYTTALMAGGYLVNMKMYDQPFSKHTIRIIVLQKKKF